MHLYIRNMAGDRCIRAVRQLLDKLGLKYRNIQLGEPGLVKEPPAKQVNDLKVGLFQPGFELLDDKKVRLFSAR